MIEFIVLGKIPGTEIYLSFNWLLVIVAGLLLMYDFRHIINRKINNKKTFDKSNS